MNKEMQIKAMAVKMEITQKEAAIRYDQFCEVIEEGIRSEGSFKLGKIVTLSVKDVAEREFCNPKNREEKITKPAHKKVVAKVVKGFEL